MAEYACVNCGGDRMCAECACAHRKQRLSRGHRLVGLESQGCKISQWVCVDHPQWRVNSYCDACGKALCENCLLEKLNAEDCDHSLKRDLSTSAQRGRSQLEQDKQVYVLSINSITSNQCECGDVYRRRDTL